jgi:integrase/recombinase XerC
MARQSYGQARALLDQHTAFAGPGAGWDLHDVPHSALTHLGRSPGVNLLLLMAKSRHRKADSLRVYFHPSGEDTAAVTALLAPGDSRR